MPFVLRRRPDRIPRLKAIRVLIITICDYLYYLLLIVLSYYYDTFRVTWDVATPSYTLYFVTSQILGVFVVFLIKSYIKPNEDLNFSAQKSQASNQFGRNIAKAVRDDKAFFHRVYYPGLTSIYKINII